MKPELLVILCTAPDAPTAEKLAAGLVEERLAACVNVVSGVTSFYRWEGNIEADAEVQMIIKTPPNRLSKVSDWLRDNHPYDVPEIIALPAADVSDAYLSWAVEQTS